jgi:hypothetical protein
VCLEVIEERRRLVVLPFRPVVEGDEVVALDRVVADVIDIGLHEMSGRLATIDKPLMEYISVHEK